MKKTKYVAPGLSALRLAVAFARTSAGRALTIDEIVDDAVRLSVAASAVRSGVEAGRSVNRHIAAVRVIAERYGAAVLDNRDAAGMVVGLRFPAGVHSAGLANTFFVS